MNFEVSEKHIELPREGHRHLARMAHRENSTPLELVEDQSVSMAIEDLQWTAEMLTREYVDDETLDWQDRE